ncbi:MAG: hypothetical protein K2M70_00045 [Lachnospiraceae bacterium]|nr:hypothetical protein [Lachnospiraceae bacterium]
MKRKTVGGLLLACALLIAGCGGETAVHTSAEAQSGEDISDALQDGEAEIQDDENAEPGEEDDGESAQMSGHEAAAVEGNFMAPVEMDETLREQLTEEMLEENEMDVSIVENAPVTKGCSFTLPEAFAESEDIEGMYVTKRYPIDASTIYYVALGRDVALQLMTEENFKAQTEENFRKEYGEDIEVTIDSFERIQIDGCPAFRILCHYQVGDTEISQLEYAINADKSYVITYSQTSDYDRMEEYEASAETIRLEF